jgi:2-(1,2-epoxy-1,2-dihydrophenyl)acetyl-CoA isomerase
MPEVDVLVATVGGICTVTLNRPKSLNSFTASMHRQLLAVLTAAAADPAVCCVVLTGAGRGFCAGQDLSDTAVAPPADGGAPPSLQTVIDAHYAPLALRVRSMPVPVIAAVNGVAAGAGANLALACDLVVAARSASFIQAFAKIGLIPDCGGSWLLPRLAGRARALGLAMLGDKLPAADAAAWGLIWQCVDDAQLSDTVAALAQRLVALPVAALARTREVFDAAQGATLAEALALEGRVQGELSQAHDYREGVLGSLTLRP